MIAIQSIVKFIVEVENNESFVIKKSGFERFFQSIQVAVGYALPITNIHFSDNAAGLRCAAFVHLFRQGPPLCVQLAPQSSVLVLTVLY